MMFQPVALFVGLRYSRSRQGSAFTRFINRFALVGIVIGVAALIVVTSVMNGFEGRLKERILGVVPQVVLSPADGTALSDWQALDSTLDYPSAVRSRTPYSQVEALIQGRGQLRAIMLQGIEPALEREVNVVEQHMVRGALAQLQPGEYGVILGRPLAYQLDVQVGEQVRLVAASGGRFTPVGVMPAQRMFRVVGLFEVGADIDTQLALTHSADLGRLLRYAEGDVGGVRLYLDDAFNASAVAAQLRRQVDPEQVSVVEWSERYGRLFEAVRMEKGMMLIMLALVVAVAAFNVVSALVMVVHDKRHDIAILQTQGFSTGQLYALLLIQGTYNGVMGTLIGVLTGIALTFALNPLLMIAGSDLVNLGQELPVLVDAGQIGAICALALGLTLLATLYPAYHATRVRPAQALRYE